MSTIALIADLTITDPSAHRVLDRIDLELPAGSVTGLVGESGSGKTTLAHALLGHLGGGMRLAGGSVRVAGRDPFAPAERRRLRGRATAYLPQDPASALDPARTIGGQLRNAVRLAHPASSRTESAELIRSAADAAALDTRLLGRYPAQLSGGQAQRALLAWTFLARPELLLLDEPTSGLDEGTAVRVGSVFSRLPWNPAVLLISHDRDLVDRIASRTFRLAGGRLCALPRPATVSAREPSPAARAPHRAGGPADSVLSMSGVTIRRGESVLLRDAHLRLAAGELLAVRGPSGSGKTSLARALSGSAPPSAGVLRMSGRVVPWPLAARSRMGGPFIAYVGQDARAALNPHERIRRSLQRAIDAGARHARSVPEDAAAALGLVGLDARLLDRTPDRLSGGQRHRVALARALAAGPAALVCDETTAALDHAGAQSILDALDELRRASGLPVLLITHQDSVAARADRLLTLMEGRLE